jgi:hypothetical protein
MSFKLFDLKIGLLIEQACISSSKDCFGWACDRISPPPKLTPQNT